MSCGSTTYALFPTPGPGRTTYSNAQYGFTIRYPSDWHLITQSNDAIAIVLYTNNRSLPNAIAFEIKGDVNPHNLSPQDWWQQHQAPDGIESPRGSITLPDKLIGFQAVGNAQGPYTIFTFTNSKVACQIVVNQSDPANAKFAFEAVNTFTWD
jgi:hypothetical protein